MISIEEAAIRAGVHKESVRRWIRQGKIPAALPSRYHGYQIDEEAFEAFLNGKHQIRYRGQVEAKEVLNALAKMWQKTKQPDLFLYARDIAIKAGLYEEHSKTWDSWSGDLLETNGNLLYSRQSEKKHLDRKDLTKKTLQITEKNLEAIEGELLLREYL